MAEPEAFIEEGGDEEMGEAEVVEEVEVDPEDGEPTGLEDVEPTVSERVTFLESARTSPLLHWPGIDKIQTATCAPQSSS